jgi:hypothetical protein
LKVRIPPETSDVVAKAHHVLFCQFLRHNSKSFPMHHVLFDRSSVDTTQPELLTASLNKPQKIKRPLHPSPLIALCLIHPDEDDYIARRNAGLASDFRLVNPSSGRCALDTPRNVRAELRYQNVRAELPKLIRTNASNFCPGFTLGQTRGAANRRIL